MIWQAWVWLSAEACVSHWWQCERQSCCTASEEYKRVSALKWQMHIVITFVNCYIITACNELWKVLYFAPSACGFYVCVWNISRTAEWIFAKFTWKMCLVPRLDEFEGQGHQGQKTVFLALSVACVRFMSRKTSLPSSFFAVFIVHLPIKAFCHVFSLLSFWVLNILHCLVCMNSPSPPVDIVWVVMIVWRIRGTYQNCSVLCCITVVHNDTHTYQQFLQITVKFVFGFCTFV